MKKILITSVGSKDPYAIPDDSKDGKYTDGPIMSILKKNKDDNTPIEEVYMYFSTELALREYKCGAVVESIKQFDGKIKVHVFPKGFIEKVGNAYQQYKKEADDESFLNDYICSDEQVGRIDVNRFGTFFKEIQPMLEDIKENTTEEERKDIEIIFNVSSGTPAMKSDINLIALTNEDFPNTIISQVGSPKRSTMNVKMEFKNHTKDELQEELKHLEEHKSSEDSSKRVIEDGMANIRKLLLLESLQDNFKKHDYSGAYHLIEINQNIIENQEIIDYVKHLYYRYIGKEDEKLNPKEETTLDLYPVHHNQQLEKIIEKYNVMKVKNERDEFNDWLLLNTPIIEQILKTLLESNKLPLIYFTKSKGSSDNLSIDTFKKSGIQNPALYDYLSKRDANYVNAGTLSEIAEIWLKKGDIVKAVKEIDSARDYRNMAAHKLIFISREDFQKNYGRDMKKAFKGLNVHYDVNADRVLRMQQLIEKLIISIAPNDKEKIIKAFSIYTTIEEHVIQLLEKEVRG